MKNFLSVFCVLCVIALLIGSASAQNRPLPLAPGKSAKIRPATQEEASVANEVVVAMRGTTSQAKTSDYSGSGQRPLFAIQVFGDSYDHGVTANAISIEAVPAATTFFGGIRNADGSERFFTTWITEEEIPAGAIWYNLDNFRKMIWSEQGGQLEYSLYTVRNNQVRRYSAIKNFGSMGLPRVLVEDGFSSNSPNGAKFYLFGNFNRNTGVVVKISDIYTTTIPNEALMVRPGMIEIDTSRVPEGYFPVGEYRFTVTGPDGYSDNGFQIRLLDYTNNSVQSNKRLELLLEKYRQ